MTAPAQYTIPLRTPFALTGSATDADGDPLVTSWEQNDRGAAAGTALMSNTKTNGPLFAMFPNVGPDQRRRLAAVRLAGREPPDERPDAGVPGSPADPGQQHERRHRLLPDRADRAAGAAGITECFSEFLPTSDYVGFAGVNASPLSLHFRFTARDGRGGDNNAETTLLLANSAGPFLVTSPNTAVSLPGGSTQTVTWDVANTDVAPVSAANVKISLSVDGGHTYPYVLGGSTPNTAPRP